MSEGWKCPECGRVNAPWVESCACSVPQGARRVPQTPWGDEYPQWPIITWRDDGTRPHPLCGYEWMVYA